MNCQEAEKLIQPYIKGNIPDKNLEAFIAHVRKCPSCYEELETYFIVNKAVAYFDDAEQTSYNLKGLLERDLREKEQMVKRHRKKERFFKILIAILILLLLVLLLHYSGVIELPWLKGLL
ncbi:MAG: zf-HC2 domain-containing protein [Fusicatenibacter sp.]|nr:zf-HC2 domain-containing protein [Lachnospiraceae bacterium]MDY2938395.1 zf-HC2 domain-containing protein [Fusicatenibacter sp.]